MYFATDASLCRNSIGFWTSENCSNFWKRYFLVWLGEDSLFYCRSINCFPDSRIRCRALGQVLYAPWFRYLLGGIVILLGIHQMEVINLRQLQSKRPSNSKESGAQWILQCFSDRGHLQFWLDPLCRTSFEFGSSHCCFRRRWCFTRCSPDAGLYIRFGAPLLSLGSGF